MRASFLGDEEEGFGTQTELIFFLQGQPATDEASTGARAKLASSSAVAGSLCGVTRLRQRTNLWREWILITAGLAYKVKPRLLVVT